MGFESDYMNISRPGGINCNINDNSWRNFDLPGLYGFWMRKVESSGQIFEYFDGDES